MPVEIIIQECEKPPRLVTIRPEHGFLFNYRFTTDFRVREAVYTRLMQAAVALPPSYRFVIYEGFRTRQRQWELWRAMEAETKARHPSESPEQIATRTREFVADPRGIGSGHQAGGAIDLSLADENGIELDLGTAIDEVSEKTHTHSPALSETERRYRLILRCAMESAGFINYPSEWWHYSYGDRLWAELTGNPVAIYGPID